MVVGLKIKIFGTLMDLCIPLLLDKIIDEAIPTKEAKVVIFWGVLMIVCSVLAWITNIIANRAASAVARDATRSIRHDLFEKIQYLSDSKVDYFSGSSLISRMTSDTYTVHQTIGMVQRLGVRAPLMLIGGIFLSIYLDPILALVMVATLPLLFFISMFRAKKGVRLFRAVQAKADKMLTVVRENIAGIRVIKALSKTDYEKERFYTVNTELTQREQKAETTMALISPIVSLIFNLGLVAVILVGAYRVNAGTSQVGTIIAFMTYFILILHSLMAITRIFTVFSKATASSARIEEVLNSDTELYELASKYHEEDKREPIIEFKDVSFKYPNSKFTLKDINFKINKGETFGIIGPTGSGKSTLIQLLMRFYDIQKGSIKINGIDIRDYSTKELRTKFGVAFQNDALFKDTIGENIRLGRDLNDEEILQASEHAQALDFIKEHGGFDAPVAIKGANLSGGQKQRLTIARALAAKPEILILDDSASALDFKTEAALRKNLINSYPDTTKIIITQRISSIMYADKIAVIDQGKIVGLGTHDYLMQTCPLYREIADSQTGGDNIE